jgi:drug/metabolite transporter (DMT)-like permease
METPSSLHVLAPARGATLFVAAVAVGMPVAAIIKLFDGRLAAVDIAAWRMLMGLPLVLGFAALHRQRAWHTVWPAGQWLRGAVMSVAAVIYFHLYQHLPIATVIAVSLVPPLFSVPAAGLLLRERVPPAHWVALAMSCLGSLLVIPPGTPTGLGVAVALLVALEATIPLMNRRVAGADPASTSTFYFMLAGTLMLMPLAEPTLPPRQDLALLGAMAVLGTAGQVLLAAAFRFAPVHVLAPFAYLQLAVGAAFDVLLFDEPLRPAALAGGAIIAAACILAARK